MIAVVLLLLLAQSSPPAIQAGGVPEIPKDLAARLAQFQSARSAVFEDFGPDGSILVSTRFAETAQLHLVPFPGGRREQVTFANEPVTSGVFIPGTADILYSMGQGGDENWQIYRLDRKSGRSSLLTDGKSRNGMGPISRKGDRMVISSTRRNGKDTDLYLLDLKSGRAEVLLETKAEYWVATDWSPDDLRLLLLRVVSVNETSLSILDLKTRERQALLVREGVKAAHGSPRFTPDGLKISFSSDARGEFKEPALIDPATMATTAIMNKR
jgi:Tol biopolymer transport system component